jgi:antitoxin component YwqK of YwqJK toxin-antitoxin module
MERKRYRSVIPKAAREVVDKSYADGMKEESSYFRGEELIGHRIWGEDGRTVLWEYRLKDGRKHGNELRFDGHGRILSIEPFRNGVAHGVARQFASDGSLLVFYTMRNGVGLDLWCYDDGPLAEEHYFPDTGQLGYNRWWNDDNISVHGEESWIDGSGWHGIHREWNHKRRLCRGFPKFYVRGQQLTKKQYLRLCETDASLPPYTAEQDQPYRALPAEFLAQRTSGHGSLESI